MRIETKAIGELLLAKYNPRKDLKPGDREYEKLKRSIEEFGYIEPVIWNERTGHVVGGHQRLKVLSGLGKSEIECVVIDVSEVQEKALNIALNKISGDWDMDKLSALLNDLRLEDIDITLTGFDLGELPTYRVEEASAEDEGGYYGDERDKTYNYYMLYEYDETRVAGYYQFPIIKAEHYIPEKLLGFNYVKSYKDERQGIGVHFFLDDYQFERMWNNPYENIERLRGFSCVFSPQFSTYRDMPMAMKIWNIYRSYLIGQMMQDAGLIVIPSLHWIEEETYKFCFDGLEPGGVVAVSTVGIARDAVARKLWYSGMDAAIERLKPECVIFYGTEIGYDFGKVSVKKFPPAVRFME